MEDVVWKNVADHNSYQASNTGLVRKISSDGNWDAVNTYESPTSVGTYINGQNLKPIKGSAFIEKDSNQQWLEFTDEEIKKFLKTGRPLGRSNTTSATSGST